MPVEDDEALLERLRAACAALLRDPLECLARVEPVPNQPAADDDAGAPAPGPAVDVHEAARVELGVDNVQGGDEIVARRHREVADRPPHVRDVRRNKVVVALELALLRQVEEEGDAALEQVADRARPLLGAQGARMATRHEAVLLDDGGWAHA